MRTAAANFASIMIRPRETMRRILDAGRDRMILPLVILSGISGFLGDFDRGSLDALRRVPGVPMPLLVCGLALVAVLVTLIIFYLFSWAAFGVGKLLEGTGTAREVRSAAAWATVPAIWALLYRVPVVFFWPQKDPDFQFRAGQIRFDAAKLGPGCLATAIVGTLELTVLIWCFAAASNTIGEAHRFSSWRGFGTIVLVMISPALIALAAFLAS